MKQLTDFSYPVHRSIMKRQLFLGVPFVPLMVLLFITIVIVLDFQQYYFLIISVLIWYALKLLTEKDEYLMEIFFQSLLQPDKLY